MDDYERFAKVKLTCEECGVIGELEGDRGALQERAEELVWGHWEDAHPYPNVRYDWDDAVRQFDGQDVPAPDTGKRPPPLSPEERKKRADQRDRGVLNDGTNDAR